MNSLALWLIAAAVWIMAAESIVFAAVRLLGWRSARRRAKLIEAAVAAVKAGDLTVEEALSKYGGFPDPSQ